MSDNMWQRFQGMLESKLDEHHISGHARHYLLPILWTAKALAAEDAEREQVSSDARSHGSPSTREDECQLSHAGAGNSAPVAGSLPPLDPALVEECLSIYESADALAVPSMRAVLNHYRERVERPLREELDTALDTMNKWSLKANDAYLEANRLLAAKHDAEAARIRDLDRCQRAEAEADRLRGELAEAEQINKLLTEQLDLHAVTNPPQPTDEERQRLADMARYYGGQGASSLVYVRADDMRRIATILEQPAPPRKSIGRRWVVRFADGEYSTRAYSYRGDAETAAKASGGTVVLCDLVPVGEEKP